MKKIILTSIDNHPHYMEGLRVFLHSARRNSPEEKFIVHLVNLDDKFCEDILKINPNIEIRRISTDEKSAFLRSHMRYKIILEAMGQYDMVAWLDNDAIIRKPMSGIWDKVTPDSLKIIYRKYYHKNPKKNTKPEVFFQGGIYVMGCGDPMKRWMSDIISGMEGKDEWYIGQALMYLVWRKNGDVRQVQLEETYNDGTFKKDSKIWHCKQSGFMRPAYQKEYQKYLKELKNAD